MKTDDVKPDELRTLAVAGARVLLAALDVERARLLRFLEDHQADDPFMLAPQPKTKAWTAEQHAKFQKTLAAKKRAAKGTSQ